MQSSSLDIWCPPNIELITLCTEARAQQTRWRDPILALRKTIFSPIYYNCMQCCQVWMFFIVLSINCLRGQREFSIPGILDESQPHFFSLNHKKWFSEVSQRWVNSVFMTEYEYEYHSVSQKWPNTNTNIIRILKNDRIRIQILFTFPKMTKYEYE